MVRPTRKLRLLNRDQLIFKVSLIWEISMLSL